jgi:lactate racemase
MFTNEAGRSWKENKVGLGYGGGTLDLTYDPRQFTVIVPEDFHSERLANEDIESVLRNPIASDPLEEIMGARDRIVIVVPDATRSAGVPRIATLLVEHLERRILQSSQISILIGGGIHRPPTHTEIRQILGPALPEKIAVHTHDANNTGALKSLGVTRQGTPVHLNRRLIETDHVILVGAINFHYVAGFSGGRKAILPGCAAEVSIQANHLLSFDLGALEKRAGIASGRLEGNPVHEDMVEAVAILAPTFLVNTVLNPQDEICAVYAGDWRLAHQHGCAGYARVHAVEIAERRPLVIVSAGGAPHDVNLIQTHKAMEHASAALEDGGTMIMVAECAQGLGRDDFLEWFVPGDSRATALKLIKDYKLNGQTAWALRKKTERFDVKLVSALDREVVLKMGMEPKATLEGILRNESRPGYILPCGLSTLPQIKSEC